MTNFITKTVLPKLNSTWKMRLFGLAKVPMLGYCWPTIVSEAANNNGKTVVRIPLGRRHMNHFRSMYFGVLCCGADLAAGYHAMQAIERQGESARKVALLFKDVHGDFHRRAMSAVHFECTATTEVDDAVKKAAETGERVNIPLVVHCRCPEDTEEPEAEVATFRLTLSLKKGKNVSMVL